ESQSFLQVLLQFRSAVAPEASSLSVSRAVRPQRKAAHPISGMQCFESCHLSQPVRSPPANKRRPLKTARYRGISQIARALRVGNWATDVPFRPLVSESAFWFLVFAGRLDPGPASTTSR